MKRYLGWKWGRDSKKYGKGLRWMKENNPKSNKKAITLKQTEEILKKEKNERNKCLFMFLFDSGARIEECLNVDFEDIKMSEKNGGYFIVHLRGTKTEEADRTIPILHHLFPEEIAKEKLLITEMGRLPNYEIFRARAHALHKMRELGINYWVKADADEIFYDDQMKKMMDWAARMHSPFQELHTFKHELYQSKMYGDEEWLSEVETDIQFPDLCETFMDRDRTSTMASRGPFGHPTLQPVSGAVAKGRWVDEAAKKLAEGVYYPDGIQGPTYEWGEFALCHYGWAKPVNRKLAKEGIWQGYSPVYRDNKRVMELEKEEEVKFLVPFFNHPEAFHRHIHKVQDFLYG